MRVFLVFMYSRVNHGPDESLQCSRAKIGSYRRAKRLSQIISHIGYVELQLEARNSDRPRR